MWSTGSLCSISTVRISRSARILVEAIRKYLKQQEIPSVRLYRGELGDSLESLWDQPEPVMTMANGGAAIAARQHRPVSLLGDAVLACAATRAKRKSSFRTDLENQGWQTQERGWIKFSQWFSIWSAPA